MWEILNEKVTSIEEAVKDENKSKKELQALKTAIKEALNCTICLTVVSPPLVLHPGCGRLIGCADCVKRSLERQPTSEFERQPACPLCREEVDGYGDFVEVKAFAIESVLTQL